MRDRSRLSDRDDFDVGACRPSLPAILALGFLASVVAVSIASMLGVFMEAPQW